MKLIRKRKARSPVEEAEVDEPAADIAGAEKAATEPEGDNVAEKGEEAAAKGEKSLDKYEKRRVKVGAHHRAQHGSSRSLGKGEHHHQPSHKENHHHAQKKKKKHRVPSSSDPFRDNVAVVQSDSEDSSVVEEVVVKKVKKEKKKRVVEVYESNDSADTEVEVVKLKREKKKKTKVKIEYEPDEEVRETKEYSFPARRGNPVRPKPKRSLNKLSKAFKYDPPASADTEAPSGPTTADSVSRPIGTASDAGTEEAAPSTRGTEFTDTLRMADSAGDSANIIVRSRSSSPAASHHTNRTGKSSKKREKNREPKSSSSRNNRFLDLMRRIDDEVVQPEIKASLSKSPRSSEVDIRKNPLYLELLMQNDILRGEVANNKSHKGVDDSTQTVSIDKLDDGAKTPPRFLSKQQSFASKFSVSFSDLATPGGVDKMGSTDSGDSLFGPSKVVPVGIQLVFVHDDEFHILPDVTIATKVDHLPEFFELPPGVVFIHRRDIAGAANERQQYSKQSEVTKDVFEKRGAVDQQLRELGISRAARFSTGLHNIDLPFGIEAWQMPTTLVVAPGVKLISGASLGPLLDLPREVMVMQVDGSTLNTSVSLPVGVDLVQLNFTPRLSPNIDIPQGLELLYSDSPIVLPGDVDLGNGCITVEPPEDLVLPNGVALVRRQEGGSTHHRGKVATHGGPKLTSQQLKAELNLLQDQKNALPSGYVPIEMMNVEDDESEIHGKMNAGVVIMRKPPGISFPPGVEMISRPLGHKFPPGMTPLPIDMYPDGLTLPDSLELVQLEPCIDLPVSVVLAPGIRAYARPANMSLPSGVHLLLCEPPVMTQSGEDKTEFVVSGSPASLGSGVEVAAQNMMPPLGMMWVPMPQLPSKCTFPKGFHVRAAKFLPGACLCSGTMVGEGVVIAEDVDSVVYNNAHIGQHVTLITRKGSTPLPVGLERGIRSDIPAGTAQLGPGLEIVKFSWCRYRVPAGVRLGYAVKLGRGTQMPPGVFIAAGLEVLEWPFGMMLDPGYELVRVSKGYSIPYGFNRVNIDQSRLLEPLPDDVTVVQLPLSISLPSNQQLAEQITVVPVSSLFQRSGGKVKSKDATSILETDKPMLPEGVVIIRRTPIALQEKSKKSAAHSLGIRQNLLPAEMELIPKNDWPKFFQNDRLMAGAELVRVRSICPLPVGTIVSPGITIAARQEHLLLPDFCEIVNINYGEGEQKAHSKGHHHSHSLHHKASTVLDKEHPLPQDLQEIKIRPDINCEPLLPFQKIVKLPHRLIVHAWTGHKHDVHGAQEDVQVANDKLSYLLFKGIEAVKTPPSLYLPEHCFLIERPRRHILPFCMKPCYINSIGNHLQSIITNSTDYVNYIYPGNINLNGLPPGVEVVKLQPFYELPRGIGIDSLLACDSHIGVKRVSIPCRPISSVAAPGHAEETKHDHHHHHKHHHGHHKHHHHHGHHHHGHPVEDQEAVVAPTAEPGITKACYIKLATGQPLGGGLYVANRPPGLFLPAGVECLSMGKTREAIENAKATLKMLAHPLVATVAEQPVHAARKRLSASPPVPGLSLEALNTTAVTSPANSRPTSAVRPGLVKELSASRLMEEKHRERTDDAHQGAKWPVWLEEVGLKVWSKCFFLNNYTESLTTTTLPVTGHSGASAIDIGNPEGIGNNLAEKPEKREDLFAAEILHPPVLSNFPMDERFVRVILMSEHIPAPRDREKVSFFGEVNEILRESSGVQEIPDSVKRVLKKLTDDSKVKADVLAKDYVIIHPRIRKLYRDETGGGAAEMIRSDHSSPEKNRRMSTNGPSSPNGKIMSLLARKNRALPESRTLDAKSLLANLTKSERQVAKLEAQVTDQRKKIGTLSEQLVQANDNIDIMDMKLHKVAEHEETLRNNIVQLKTATALSERMAALRAEDVKKARTEHQKTKEKLNKDIDSLHAQLEMWRDITPVMHEDDDDPEDASAKTSRPMTSMGVSTEKYEEVSLALSDTTTALKAAVDALCSCFQYCNNNVSDLGGLEGSEMVYQFPIGTGRADQARPDGTGLPVPGLGLRGGSVPAPFQSDMKSVSEGMESVLSDEVGNVQDDVSVLTLDEGSMMLAPDAASTDRAASQGSIGDGTAQPTTSGVNKMPVTPFTVTAPNVSAQPPPAFLATFGFERENLKEKAAFNLEEEAKFVNSLLELIYTPKKKVSLIPLAVEVPFEEEIKEMLNKTVNDRLAEKVSEKKPAMSRAPSSAALAKTPSGVLSKANSGIHGGTLGRHESSRIGVYSSHSGPIGTVTSGAGANVSPVQIRKADSIDPVLKQSSKIVMEEPIPLEEFKHWLNGATTALKAHVTCIRNSCFNFVQAADCELESQSQTVSKLRKRVVFLEGAGRELENKYNNQIVHVISLMDRANATQGRVNNSYTNAPQAGANIQNMLTGPQLRDLFSHYQQNRVLKEQILGLENYIEMSRKFGSVSILTTLEERGNQLRVLKEVCANCKFNLIIANQKIAHNTTNLRKNAYTSAERKAIRHFSESLSKKVLAYAERIKTLEDQYEDLNAHLFDEIRYLECRLQGIVPADILTQAIMNGARHANDAKRKPNTEVMEPRADPTVAENARLSQIDMLYYGTTPRDQDSDSVSIDTSALSIDTSISTVYPSKPGGTNPPVAAPPPVGSLNVTKSFDIGPMQTAVNGNLSMRDRIALLLSQDRPLGQTGTMPLAPIVKKHTADEIREKYKHSLKAKEAARDADNQSVMSGNSMSRSGKSSVIDDQSVSGDSVTVGGSSRASNQSKLTKALNKPFDSRIQLKTLAFGKSPIDDDAESVDNSVLSFNSSASGLSLGSSYSQKKPYRVDPPPVTMLTSLNKKIGLKPVGRHAKNK